MLGDHMFRKLPPAPVDSRIYTTCKLITLFMGICYCNFCWKERKVEELIQLVVSL